MELATVMLSGISGASGDERTFDSSGSFKVLLQLSFFVSQGEKYRSKHKCKLHSAIIN